MGDVTAAGGGLGHVALFYRDQAGYLARAAAFGRAGLAREEPLLIAVPGRTGRLLRGHLRGAPGPVAHLDMAEVGRNPARIIPAVQAFIDEHQGSRVRCVGEPIWLGRSAAEAREVVRHEALVNIAFVGRRITLLCAYDAASLAPSVLADAERTHPVVLDGGQPQAAVRYAGPGDLPEPPLPAPPADAEAMDYETDLWPVRRLVAGHARRTGLPGGRTADLVLAASEIAANTLRHTRNGGTLRVWHTSDEVLCELHDRGHIDDPLAGRRRNPPGTSGQGLWVVNQLCDLVEMRSGRAGTTVRLHMQRRSFSAAGPVSWPV